MKCPSFETLTSVSVTAESICFQRRIAGVPRVELPQQGRSVAVPADGERQHAERRGRLAHVDRPTEPAVRHHVAGAEHPEPEPARRDVTEQKFLGAMRAFDRHPEFLAQLSGGAGEIKSENLPSSALPQVFADRYGWREMATVVKAASSSPQAVNRWLREMNSSTACFMSAVRGCPSSWAIAVSWSCGLARGSPITCPVRPRQGRRRSLLSPPAGSRSRRMVMMITRAWM